MNTRSLLVALASGALALGIAGPVAHAAPRAAEQPAAKAYVRVDGGTAYAKKTGKHEYRIVMPKGAEVTWLGPVASGETHSGTFTKKGLIAGWKRLGYASTPAGATLMWGRVGDLPPEVREAKVSKPKINGDGQLTFLAKVKGSLPTAMSDFSINLAPGSSQQSRYPVTLGKWWFDSTAYTNVTLQSDQQATVHWSCRSDVDLKNDNYYAKLPTFTCGDITINGTTPSGTPSEVWGSWPQGRNGTGHVYADLGVIPASGGAFEWSYTLATYNSGGSGASPTTDQQT